MPHRPRSLPGPPNRLRNRHLSWRTLLRATGLAVTGAALGGAVACSSPDGGADADAVRPLTIGFVPIACSAPVILADAEGLFAAHGVDVRLKKYAGWTDLWTAYATGELDVAHMLSPMPAAIDSGRRTRPAPPS